MTLGRTTEGKDRPRISPADIVFLAVVFCLVCTAFAISGGLGLGDGGGGRLFETAGGGVLRVGCVGDGAVEVQGRLVKVEDLAAAVRLSAAGREDLAVVAEYSSGVSAGFVAGVLDTLRSAGVRRISVREVAR